MERLRIYCAYVGSLYGYCAVLWVMGCAFWGFLLEVMGDYSVAYFVGLESSLHRSAVLVDLT